MDRPTLARRALRLGLAAALIGALLPLAVASPAAAAGLVPTRAAIGGAGFDGDATTTERLNQGDPIAAAIDIAQLRFAGWQSVGRHVAHVVLSRDDTFADSLAGTVLTGDGALLFTHTDSLNERTADEIDRLLVPGGRIYLLGGTAAISAAVANQLTLMGYVVERLDGASRVETSVAVAQKARELYGRSELLLARAYGPADNPTAAWADSVTGGGLAAGSGVPVVVTPTESLHPAVAAFIAGDAPSLTVLLGGTLALSQAVQDGVPNPARLSGLERTATASDIAIRGWGASATGARRFVVVNGEHEDGWAFGLAAAGLSADAAAPVLLVTFRVTEATQALLRTCGTPQVDVHIVGDGTLVSGPVRERIDAFDGEACGAGGKLLHGAGLEGFDDCGEVLAFFKENALERVGPYGMDGYNGGPYPMPEPAREDDGGFPAPAPEAPASGDDGGTSGTNVQEEGVDEPDIVKTDGDIALVIAQGDLQVIDLDSNAPNLAATLDLPDGSHELLLHGDVALVLTTVYAFAYPEPMPVEGDAPASGSIAPDYYAYEPTTQLTFVNVSDPANPTVTATVELDGEYRSARMVGSVARVVLQDYPSGLEFTYPADDSEEAMQAATEHNRGVIEDSVIGNWLPSFVARNGAGEKTDGGRLVGCDRAHQPPWFSGMGTVTVVTLDLAGAPEPTGATSVVASGELLYASPDRLYITTSRWGFDEFDAAEDTVRTEIHGFDISQPTTADYIGSGDVGGFVLNTFALSEHEGFLRVATTTQPPWREDGQQAQSESAVTVLAEDGGALVEVGHVGGIGVGERIFGVRFLGDIGAVVTFLQIDPLHLLDLSDPTDPRVMGELHVPGYSAYLHRVGDDRLLGVGRDGTEDGQLLGPQVSLFDISDLTAPALLDRVTWEGYGDTPVEYDHRAFLYWPATSLAVLPLNLYDDGAGSSFTGAVGVDVGTNNVTEAGQVDHGETCETYEPGYEYCYGPYISRSFVSGGAVYTVSETGILRSDLDTLANEGFLEFPTA